jgi:hypothetical protein
MASPELCVRRSQASGKQQKQTCFSSVHHKRFWQGGDRVAVHRENTQTAGAV